MVDLMVGRRTICWRGRLISTSSEGYAFGWDTTSLFPLRTFARNQEPLEEQLRVCDNVESVKYSKYFCWICLDGVKIISECHFWQLLQEPTWIQLLDMFWGIKIEHWLICWGDWSAVPVDVSHSQIHERYFRDGWIQICHWALITSAEVLTYEEDFQPCRVCSNFICNYLYFTLYRILCFAIFHVLYWTEALWVMECSWWD